MSKFDTTIAILNELELGSLDKISAQLVSIRGELERFNLLDLVEKTDACRHALVRGELQEFRRLRNNIVSQLGHHRMKFR